MNLPSLRQLRFLVALDDELHFGRAAEACFVTQSTLSAAIAELEALLRAGCLKHAIGARFPLSQIAAAHEAVEKGSVVGNVVLTI